MNAKKEKRQDRISFRYALSALLPICVFSLFFAFAFCYVANDIYAFVKKESSVDLTIDEAQSLNEISSMLEELGVIENPAVFSLYVKSKGKQGIIESFSGDINLDTSMSYREIVASFS